MLEDSAHIQESDVRYINQRRQKQGKSILKPLYSIDDAKACLPQFVEVPYNTDYKIEDDIYLTFTDSGHILGSAAVNLKIQEDHHVKTLTFTGDIGRAHPAIIRDPQPFPQCEYLITESTYGDRLHEDQNESLDQLLRIVIETCVMKKGKLIIPAFSVGRTQEIVYRLDQLENEGRLPHIKVFVDSPLSTNATEIMRSNSDCFNDEVKAYMESDKDPFGFNRLTYIRDVEQSKRLNSYREPCIIISASGMAEAGRIKHHIANSIEHPENTILIVGHCEPQSLGGRLTDGAQEVRIFGETYEVKAHVVVMGSLSAHGDYKEMLDYLSCQNASKVKKVFVVHGEYPVQLAFMSKLKKAGYKAVEIPERGSSYKL
jgi:metallo-beta-lactamase family protein